MSKPNAQTVSRAREHLLAVWREAHSNWRRWREIYDNKTKVRCVAPALPFHLGIGRAKINAMADTLFSTKPVVRRNPKKDSPEAKARADKLEKWAVGALGQSIENNPSLPFRQAVINMSIYGYTSMEVRYEDGEVKPFVVNAPHPARILLPPFERVPSFAVQSFNRLVRDLKREYPKVRMGTDEWATAECTMYMDEEWMALTANGQEIEVRRNPYGLVQCIHAFAGFGIEGEPYYNAGSGGQQASEETLPSLLAPQPEDIAQGLFAGSEDTLKSLDEFYTAMHAMALTTAYRTRLVDGGNLDALAKAYSEAGLGGMVPKDGAEVKWEDSPHMEAWVFQSAEMARAALEQSTFSGVVEGQRSPGINTATQHAIMLGSARQRFGVPMAQLNYLGAQALALWAQMIVKRDEDVTINGVTVKPDDFEGNYAFEVDFVAKDEGSVLRKKADGRDELKMGVITPRIYNEENGRENAAEIEDQTVVYKLANSERALNILLDMALGELAKRHGGAPTPTPTQPNPMQAQPGAQPQSLVPHPSGPQAMQAQQQMMGQVPGEGIERAMPQ